MRELKRRVRPSNQSDLQKTNNAQLSTCCATGEPIYRNVNALHLKNIEEKENGRQEGIGGMNGISCHKEAKGRDLRAIQSEMQRTPTFKWDMKMLLVEMSMSIKTGGT